MKKIFGRVLSGAAAAGAAFGAAGALVVALCFALYAFAKTYVGAAGASAVVAAVLAVLLGVGLIVAARGASNAKAKAAVHKAEPEPANMVASIMDMARDRPLAAAAAALAAGVLSLRNPTLVATVLGLLNQPRRPRRP